MMRNKIIVFVLLISLATLARVNILFHSDNFDGSFATGRVAAALCILEDPSLRLNFDGNTSILYHYLLAAALHCWHDPLITPRIFTMLFGILLIIPFYLLIEILFNQEIAFYSSILLSFYPKHAIQSTLSTPDVVFHFFFFSCLYYFFKFKLKEKKVFWLILSSILLNITAMLRFESWAFIPLLSVFLYKDGKRYLMAFFLLSLILPSIWLYLCHQYARNIFYSFTSPASTAHAEILLRTVPYSKEILGWLNVLAKAISAPIVISGVCGIFYSFTRRKFRYLALFFLYLYFLYTVNTLLEKMWLNERYSILLGLLILPYSILCIQRISLFLKLKPIILLLPFVLFSLLQFQKITISRMPILPEGVKEVANWLKFHASSKDRIILGPDAWNTTDQNIVVRSGLSLRNFLVVNTPLVPGAEANLPRRIKTYIADKKPRYLILNSIGFLNKTLGFDMGQNTQDKFGCNFRLLFSKSLDGWGICNIYEIYRKDN